MNRRNVLAGASLAVTLQTAAIAQFPIRPPVDRSAWEAAIRALREIEAEEAEFSPRYLEIWNKCREECEAVPHVTFAPEEYSGGFRQTTADEWAVRQARKDVRLLDEGRMHLDPLPGLREHYAIKRDLVKAADDRERQKQAIRNRYDMDALDDRDEQLSEAKVAAWVRLMETPAPDMAALKWKLGELREGDGDLGPYTAELVEQTYADIERLLH